MASGSSSSNYFMSQGMTIGRPKGRKRAHQEEKPELLFKRFASSFEPPMETVSLRFNLFVQCFEKVEKILEELDSEWSGDIAEKVGDFVRSSVPLLSGEEMVTPIGFISAGPSNDDNGRLFDRIREEIENGGHVQFLARLSSSHCPNVKVGFQNICKQLLQNNANASQFYETRMPDPDGTFREEDEVMEINSRYLSIHDLQKWYEQKGPKDFEDSFNSNQSLQIIAVIVEDAESCSQVIPQLLQLLSCSGLPILFLFGVPHTFSNLDRFIPNNSSTSFVYKTFHSTSSEKRMNRCFTKVLNARDVLIKPSGTALEFITSCLRNQGFSISGLLQTFKMGLLNHFRKSASIFCEDISEKTLIPDGVLLQSFSCISNEEEDQIWSMVREGKGEFQWWMLCLNMLESVRTCLINNVDLAENFTDLYIQCATGSFFSKVGESSFSRLLKAVYGLNESALEELLKSIKSVIKDYVGSDFHKFEPSFEANVDELFKQTGILLKSLKEDNTEKHISIIPAQQERSKLKTRMKLKELQTTLLSGIKSKKETSNVAKVRQKVADFLKETFEDSLISLTSRPCYTCFIFDDVQVLNGLFRPSPINNITCALLNPSYMLQCTCCQKVESESIVRCLPDTSIVFKLLQEHTTKKVDLNLICEGFMSIVEEDSISGKRRKKSVSSETQQQKAKHILARFLKATTELQHMGILKRSKGKTDEITKIVWF